MREKKRRNEQSVSGEWENEKCRGGRSRRVKERERERESEREAGGQVLLSVINTCNAPIDRRNQLLKATREGRF